ncbi:MAG: HAMP domain-containing sensor histidine kinase [Patescibacteria group bacterium]
MLRNYFKTGLHVLYSSNRLLFVVSLLFIFPLLFLYITNTFAETAKLNIETAEKRRVAVLHDSLQVLVGSYNENQALLREFLTLQQRETPDVTEIRITKKTAEGYLIVESYDDQKEGSYESVTDMYSTAQPGINSSLIFEFTNHDERTWQVVRAITVGAESYYVLSEHTFKDIDSLMQARKQQSYLGLTAIFAFLIALAYWFGRQIDWHKRYDILAAKMKERDLFTTMIAHEFRTPLTAIRGYNSFLAESISISEQEKTFVTAISQSTDRLLALVNDFLEVAKIQSGKMDLIKSTVDVQPIIMAVCEALQPIAREKKLELSFHKLAVPIVINTDTKRLYQILQNLISNALKYTKQGAIEVTLDVTPKTISIRIKDTGMGITADDQQKLFAPFARVGGVEKTSITGTGLGMWITKQLVAALDGTITVESIKDIGTHVVLGFRR